MLTIFLGIALYWHQKSFLLLQWEVFSSPQLEEFEGMLNRLMKKDMEDCVNAYERYRVAMEAEVARRERDKS